MTNTSAEGDARWAAALNLAGGFTDENLPRRRRRVLLFVAALIVCSWIVGFVVAVYLFPVPNDAHHTTETDSQLVAEFIFLGLGFVVGIVGFVWARRTGHYITRWRSVASPLSRSEKRSVSRQIAGKETVDEAHLRVIVAIAKQNRKATPGVIPIYSALVLFAIATAVGSEELWIKLVELVAGLLFIFAAVQLLIAYRRAGRFVAARLDKSDSTATST